MFCLLNRLLTPISSVKRLFMTTNSPPVCKSGGSCNGDGTCSYVNKMNGTACNDGTTCSSELCLPGAFTDGGGACTAPCVTSADCPAAAPLCAPITYDTPSGAAQPGNGCVAPAPGARGS